MTLSTTDNRRSYTGDGSSVTFAFPFLFLEDSHLQVYLDGALQASGYSVAGAGDDAGGSVTFTTAPASGVLVVLVRVPDLLQTTDLPSNGPFPSQAVERMADKAMMAIQRVQDITSRAVHVADGDADVSLVLPLSTARASKVMAFDANGVPVAIEGTPTVLQTQAPETGGVLEFASVWIQRERLHPAQFGCSSGLGSDQTTNFLKAINAASSRGMPLNLQGRQWRIDAASSLVVPVAGIEIENGTIVASSMGSGKYVASTAGAIGTGVTVTSSIARETQVVPVASSAGLVVGGWYKLASSDYWSDNGAGITVTLGELVRIQSIDSGTQITLLQPTRDSYTTSPKLYPITWVDHVFLENVHFTGGGAGQNQNGLSLDYVRDVRIYGSDTRSFAARGCVYNTCQHVDIDGGMPGDGDDSTGLSYGHLIMGATLTARARNVRGDSLRHVVTAGGSSGVVRGYRLDGISGTNMTDATVDAHPAVDDAVFNDIRHEANTFWLGGANPPLGSDGDGIVSQARSTQIDCYMIRRPGRHGILIQPACKVYKGVAKIGQGEVRDHGSYSATTGWGINFAIDYPNSLGLIQASVDGADIESAQSTANGIQLSASTSGVGYGNMNARVTTPGRAVLAFGNGQIIANLQLAGGYYERTTTTGEVVYFSGASAGQLTQSKLTSAYVKGGNNAVRGTNTTSMNISLNTIKGYSVAAIAGITHDGTSNFVTNNET